MHSKDANFKFTQFENVCHFKWKREVPSHFNVAYFNSANYGREGHSFFSLPPIFPFLQDCLYDTMFDNTENLLSRSFDKVCSGIQNKSFKILPLHPKLSLTSAEM